MPGEITTILSPRPKPIKDVSHIEESKTPTYHNHDEKNIPSEQLGR